MSNQVSKFKVGDKQDVLDRLPITEVRETFWWREFYENGTLIERHHLLFMWYRSVRSELHRLKMRIKGAIAFWLLSGFGEACPYCDRVIDIGRWKKLVDEE